MDRDTLEHRFKDRWDTIPNMNESVVLDEIGNYSRGSKFFSLQNMIDDSLVLATDQFFREIKGLDFFRMDFKAHSLADYKEGKFKILEVNGMKSEPLHIYDPQYSHWENTKTTHRHWSIIRDIVKERKSSQGYKFPSTFYGIKSLFAIKKLVK